MMKRFDSIYLSSRLKLHHGFGTKSFGDGRDITFMNRYLKGNKLLVKSIIVPNQTHSTKVEVITKTDQAIVKVSDADGLVTLLESVVLTVVTADCVPIIFRDDVKGVIGISHQGWKGTVENLPAKMIEKMMQLGAQRENINCAIGPSINACCYEIFGPRYKKFKDLFGEEVFQKRGDKIYLMLNKANYWHLIRAGIRPSQIDFFPFCTSCNSNEFWSYSRDKGINGEMLSFVLQ